MNIRFEYSPENFSESNINTAVKVCDAVIKAYESSKTAKSGGADSVADIGNNVFSAVWSTLKTPVLEALKGVFDTFANAMQEFLNFLFKPLTDFIDLLPFC